MNNFFSKQKFSIYCMHIYPSGNSSVKIQNDRSEIDFKLSDKTVDRIMELISNDVECKEDFSKSFAKSIGINEIGFLNV